MNLPTLGIQNSFLANRTIRVAVADPGFVIGGGHARIYT